MKVYSKIKIKVMKTTIKLQAKLKELTTIKIIYSFSVRLFILVLELIIT